MTDTSHLSALRVRLSHERTRLAGARTKAERNLREVWVAGIEREIAAELKFLGIEDHAPDLSEMGDDDILAELGL